MYTVSHKNNQHFDLKGELPLKAREIQYNNISLINSLSFEICIKMLCITPRSKNKLLKKCIILHEKKEYHVLNSRK